jgi:hypothetical protein
MTNQPTNQPTKAFGATKIYFLQSPPRAGKQAAGETPLGNQDMKDEGFQWQ